jgi:hypothetical protein
VDSSDWHIREAAAWALGEIPVALSEMKAMTALARASRDVHESVRAAAVWALGKHQTAHGNLVSALEDPESVVRVAASYALGNMKDTRSVAPLVAAMKDPDIGVREAASKALSRLKEAGVM